MSHLRSVRERLSQALSPHHVKITVRIDRQVAYHLVPIIERIAPGTSEAWTALTAIRPFFRDDRPVTAMVCGDDIRLYEEGPNYICGKQTFPLGAQLFVSQVGWINLGPVDAVELHSRLRAAIDQAAYRWISERDKLALASPWREPRVRAIDDYLAKLEMAAAVAGPLPESAADDI